MQDYRVQLEAYAGPLDLLLYLVKRHEIDLHDIPMHTLCEQYLEHLKLIQEIDINLAADFLVMAATLLEIKSQMLVPVAEREDDDEDAEDALNDLDPRYELVQQLLEYKRFKDAAMDLEDRAEQWGSRFAARPTKLGKRDQQQADNEGAGGEVGEITGDVDDDAEDAEPIEIELDDVSILDLCEAFARMLDSIGQAEFKHEVVYDDTPIGLHAEDIVDRLQRDGAMTLQQMFVGRKRRTELIGLFLATLELVKQHRVRVLQDRVLGEIKLQLIPDTETEPANDNHEAPDWRDPDTGEVQYDWPSEEIRQRAERRSKRRMEIAMKRRRGEEVEDADEDDIIDLDDENFEDEQDRELSGDDESQNA